MNEGGGILTKAKMARAAALKLATATTAEKDNALLRIADSIDKNRARILAANTRDLELAKGLVSEGKLSKALLYRLLVDDAKINDILKSVRDVAKLEDPVGKTLSAIELDKDLELFQVACPIGVIGVIFEARPDALVQISSLCLKTGNAVLLKGGSEARYSNEALFEIIAAASTAGDGIPDGWIQLLETREEVGEMLQLNEYINLIVPRGSNQLVKYIQENTKIMVLGHSEGLCHVYVDRDAEMNRALDICYDAKVQYPAVCNAMETLLVDSAISGEFLPRMVDRYLKAGVEIRACPRTMELLKGTKELKPATEEDWRTEYNDLIISIKVVNGVNEAIEHINYYGSGHTDAIVTENKKTALTFMQFVDSSSVMHNASTRFSDGFRYGKGAEVGISTYKVHARGPVGLEGLVSYKYLLVGNGHVVAPYIGTGARQFTHRRLSKDFSFTDP
ncbi:MAG: glutamate-5-semialdehyde dehydrogenase [Methanophagales archaeon ANME-1-THS]|nr:MAG: glutamate-5-semialdehyde dehydrogenase [Methanophagales archaeon ANME-1-THS]